MPREESIIFRFVTEGKDKALRDFKEVEGAAQRTAEAMGGRQQQTRPGERQRGTQGGPWGAPAGTLVSMGGFGGAPFASLPPIAPSMSGLKVDSALVNTIAQVVSETLREAMTRGAQSAERAVGAQVQATQRQVGGPGSTFMSQPTEYLSPQEMQNRARGQSLSSQTSPEVLARIRAQQTGIAPQASLPPISRLTTPTGGAIPKGAEWMADWTQKQADEALLESTAFLRSRRPPVQSLAGSGAAAGVRPSDIVDIPISAIRADPNRFQWRPDARAGSGSTGRLSGVRRFNYQQAQVIDVVEDEGGFVVAQGHNRLDLGKRSIEAGLSPPDQPIRARILRGMSDADVLREGGWANIREGQAFPREIASFARRFGYTGEQLLADPELNRNRAENIAGAALADLSPALYERYQSRQLSESRAVAIGRMGLTPSVQERLYTDIQKLGESRGRRLSDEEFDVYLRRAANTAVQSESQTDMFGQITSTRSLLNERVQVEAGVLSRLRSSRTALGQLGRESLVELGRQSGVLSGDVNVGGARDLAAQTAQAIDAFKALADKTDTAVSRLLNQGAEQVAGGANLEEVIANVTREVASPEFVRQAVRGGMDYNPTLAQAGAAAPQALATTGTRSPARAARTRMTPEEVAARRQQIAEQEGYSSYQEYEAGLAERRRIKNTPITLRERTPAEAALAAERAKISGEAERVARGEDVGRLRAGMAESLSGISAADRRALEREGFGFLFGGGGGMGGGGGGDGGGGAAFDTSGIPDDPNAGINAQRSRTLTAEGMGNIRGQDQRAAGANARLRRIEQRINTAINTIEELGPTSQGSPAQQSRIRRGLRAAQTPDLGAQGLFNPSTGRFTTSGIGVSVEDLESRFQYGLQQATGAGISGQRRRAEEATARREGIAGNITSLNAEDFEVRQSRMRLLQRQIGVYRTRLDEGLDAGRRADDPEIRRISAQLGQASEAYETLAKQGKMGFGVDQGGFVGALQKASFKAFPFTIGAFAVQSGTAPLAGGATRFQQAYEQLRPQSLADIEAREGLRETEARLGEQGAGVNRFIQRAGAAALRATEPYGGGYAVAGGAAVGAVVGSGLNIAGLAIALREMAGGVRAATAGLGGLGGVAARLTTMFGGVGGAAIGGAAQGAAGGAGQLLGGAAAGAAGGAAARGGLRGLLGVLAPAAGIAAGIAAGVGANVLGTRYGQEAAEGTPLQGFADWQFDANLRNRPLAQQISQPRGLLMRPGEPEEPGTFGPPAPSPYRLLRAQEPQFAAFEARQVEEQRLAGDTMGYAYRQAQLRERQGQVGFAQFERGQAFEERADARSLARLDRQQGLEIQQINVQADRQASALGRGYSRQVRGAELGRDRATRAIGQQLTDSFEDIGIQAGRQTASAGRQFGRTLRDIGIGEGESRADIDRGLGRTLASIERQGGRSREEIDRGTQRGFQDIVLGQVGGIAGQVLQLGVGRARALEDLEREQGLAREDAQRAAGEAGEDLTTESGRARARARRGLGDTTEDIGVGAGEARADAGRAYDRGARSIGQQFEDTLADANQSYKDALSDLTTATKEAISDRKQIGTTERENLEAEIAERAAMRQQLKDDYLFQLELVRVANQNLTDQTRIYEDWNKAIEKHTKAVSAAADNIKLGSARALTGS